MDRSGICAAEAHSQGSAQNQTLSGLRRPQQTGSILRPAAAPGGVGEFSLDCVLHVWRLAPGEETVEERERRSVGETGFRGSDLPNIFSSRFIANKSAGWTKLSHAVRLLFSGMF